MDFSLYRTGVFSEEEKLFLDKQVNHSNKQHLEAVVAQMYSAKLIKISVDNFSEATKNNAESNEKYAKGMNWLTGGLVFVGVVQIVIQILQLYLK
jgi:antirestriction protein